MKLACSTLAFANIPLASALREVRDLGFGWVDIACFEGWAHLNPSEMVGREESVGQDLKILLESFRLKPSALHSSTSLRPSVITSSEEEQRVIVEVEALLQVAQVSHTPLVNIQLGPWPQERSRQEVLDFLVHLLRLLVSKAQSAGVELSFEAHSGAVGERPEEALYLLEHCPGLGLDYDPTHFVAQGIPLEETQPLIPYVKHLGIRNARPGNYNLSLIADHLDYDMSWLMNALQEVGYQGVLAVEYYVPNVYPSVRKLAYLLESLLAKER